MPSTMITLLSGHSTVVVPTRLDSLNEYTGAWIVFPAFRSPRFSMSRS